MRSCVLLVGLLTSSLARAGAHETMVAAVAAAENEPTALLKLFELRDSADPAVRFEAEFQLAAALRQRKLRVSSFVYAASIVEAGPSHPFFRQGVELLLQVQADLDDNTIIPALLMKVPTLPSDMTASAAARAAFLKAGILNRTAMRAQAVELLSSVPTSSPLYAKALYLKAVVLADPRFPGGPQVATAQTVLEAITAIEDPLQEDLETLKGLATIGVGRLLFGSHRQPEAAAWFAKAEKWPELRARALFEGSHPRFLSGDEAGAIAALRSAEVAEASIPEAAIFEASMLHLRHRDDEATRALEGLTRLTKYNDNLRARANAAQDDPRALIALVDTYRKELDLQRRAMGVVNLVRAVEIEKATIAKVPQWKDTALAKDLVLYLDSNGTMAATLMKGFVANLVTNANNQITLANDLAAVIRFEIALSRGRPDPAISALEAVAARLETTSIARAELLFHLACLYRASALSKPASARPTFLAQAQKLTSSVLVEFPKYERLDEVLFLSAVLADEQGDPGKSREALTRLRTDFPTSPLVAEASQRLEK